jgi:hypothetical protein
MTKNVSAGIYPESSGQRKSRGQTHDLELGILFTDVLQSLWGRDLCKTPCYRLRISFDLHDDLLKIFQDMRDSKTDQVQEQDFLFLHPVTQ